MTWRACLALGVGWFAFAAAPLGLASPTPEAREPTGDPGPALTPVLGVNADLTRYDAARLDAIARRLAAAGIRHVRQPVRWADIEPTPGRFAWDDLDRVVDVLTAHRIRPLFTLHTSPAWARRDPPPPSYWFLCPEDAATDPAQAVHAPPTDESDLAAFAAALVSRYRGRAWAVEVWREPNILPNWRRAGPDPEDYARLLTATASAVKRAAPDVLVVSAGLAPTTDIGVCHLSDVVFLDRLARTGALARVDAVGIEPFGLRAPADDRRVDRDTLNFARAEALHAVLARHEVPKPLWAVAWGWNARTGSWDDRTSPWGTHPPADAARWTVEAWSRARAEWPWLGPMVVWQLQPGAPEGDPAWGFALLDPADRPTILWGAVADIAAGQASMATSHGSPAPDAGPPPGSGSPPAPSASPDSPLSRVPARPSTGASPGGISLPWSPLKLVTALLMLALAAGALVPRVRGRLGPLIGRAIARFGRLDSPRAAVVYGLLVVANVFAPWPIGLAALPLIALLAAARPAVAAAAAAAMLPFYHTVLMQLGPRPVSPVALLVWAALGGRLLAWYGGRGWAAEGSGGSDGVSPAGPSRVVAMANGQEGHRPGASRPARAAMVLDGTVLLLVLWATASLVWSEFPAPARYQWRSVIVEPAVYYALLRTLPERRAGLRVVLDGLVIGAVVTAGWALFGVALYAAGIESRVWTAVSAEGVLRARGPFGSPNNLALYLGRVVPVLAAVTVWGGGAWGDRATRRGWYALAAAPIGLALLATFSRAAVIVGLPAVAVCLAWAAGLPLRRMAAVLAAVAVVAAVLFLPFAGTDRVRQTFSLAPGGTLFIRSRLWVSAYEMGRDHPWLGVGLDNFLYHYRDRYVKREVVQDGSLSHPHNWLLDWWTRLGIPGVLIFGALAAGNLSLGRRALRRAPGPPADLAHRAGSRPDVRSPPDRPLAAAGLGMQVYALAHGLVDNSFFLVDLAAAWWIGQACLIAAMGPAARGPWGRVESAGAAAPEKGASR